MRRLEVCLKCIAILFGQGLHTPLCQAGVMKWTPKVRRCKQPIYAPQKSVVKSRSLASPFPRAPPRHVQGNSSEAPIVVAARKVGLSENIAGDLPRKRVADGRSSC